MRRADAVVVGAGIAGLRAARGLADRGLVPVVLERSRGVGGRCATRRVEGQPVDHGVAFVHGTDPELLEFALAVPGGRVLDGWPFRIEGDGAPCQPRAFGPRERRLAYAQGISALPKHLSAGLSVEKEVSVASLAVEGAEVRVETSRGDVLAARRLVLALPVESSAALLEPIVPHVEAAETARALLAMASSRPSLTCIAAYDRGVPDVGWDVLYPERSPILQLVSHDSAKRETPARRVLVLQARPTWSRGRLHDPPETWAGEMLRELGRLEGDWAASPVVLDPHRWTWARLDGGDELASPLLLRTREGGTIGLAGEYFGAGGGLEAAWVSGRRLAERIAEEG